MLLRGGTWNLGFLYGERKEEGVELSTDMAWTSFATFSAPQCIHSLRH